MTPGSRIRKLREKKDWSQKELAKRISINNSVLSRIEADKRPIETDLLARFCEVFGVSSDFILGMKPDEPGKKKNTSKDGVQDLIDYLMSNPPVDGKPISDELKNDLLTFIRIQKSLGKL